jgi:hypothetical protein
VVTAGAGGAVRFDWAPQLDQITLGTHTTGNYAGSSTEGGSAISALSLAADPTDCAAGNWAQGVSASGVAAGCTPDDDSPDTDAEVPDAITVTGTVDGKDAGASTTRPTNGATVQLLRHDIDCPALAGAFKAGEVCLEEDSNRLFSCRPTAGDCDTRSEWALVTEGATQRFVDYFYTPDEHWPETTDQLSWSGYATYSGGAAPFVAPGFSTILRSTLQVAHNGGEKQAFRYRPAASAGNIVLRARAGITFQTSAGVMIDDGVDAGDGAGATNFYRVYLRQQTLGGPMTVVEEYRIGGGAVVTNVGPAMAYGEFVGIGLRCLSGGVWTSYQCSPFTFGESREPVQFTTGGPAMSWTPVRGGLYSRFSAPDFGRRAMWDWYDEAVN